jgi:hypothetical protein
MWPAGQHMPLHYGNIWPAKLCMHLAVLQHVTCWTAYTIVVLQHLACWTTYTVRLLSFTTDCAEQILRVPSGGHPQKHIGASLDRLCA